MSTPFRERLSAYNPVTPFRKAIAEVKKEGDQREKAYNDAAIEELVWQVNNRPGWVGVEAAEHLIEAGLIVDGDKAVRIAGNPDAEAVVATHKARRSLFNLGNNKVRGTKIQGYGGEGTDEINPEDMDTRILSKEFWKLDRG